MTDALMPIPQRDQARIAAEVEAYRQRIEQLYRLAYLQGAIDAAKEARERITEK